MQSALARGGPDASTQKLKTINKSLAKLDHISQINWSKRDLNLDTITAGNQVFNRTLNTQDPRAYGAIYTQSQLNSRLSHLCGAATEPHSKEGSKLAIYSLKEGRD